MSAYTLTFGGFLLLAGVLSDRLGRRAMFTAGMLWMMAASIACGVARTGVQCIVFRALQGLGAAASVPSAIGVLSNFFVGNEKHRALSMFGAAGAVGEHEHAVYVKWSQLMLQLFRIRRRIDLRRWVLRSLSQNGYLISDE